MSLEFLRALSQGNVVHPQTPSARPHREPFDNGSEEENVFTHEDINEVHNPPITPPPTSLFAHRSRASSSSSRRGPSSSRHPANLVQHDPSLDPIAELDPLAPLPSSSRRARLLLRQSLARGSPLPLDVASPPPPTVDDVAAARARRRAKKARDLPDRDRPRYLANVGLIHAHLPSLLALLDERLMQRDFPSAARLLSVLFRVRRLDAESVFRATTQLLPLASSNPLADMVRLYRRYVTYRPAPAKGRSFPPVLVKNAAQVVLELTLMFLRQGMLQHAYDELSAWITQPPFDEIGLYHGYLGVIAFLMARQQSAQVEEMRARGVSDDAMEEEDEDDAPISFSLAHFTQSLSQRTGVSHSSTAALVTARQRMRVHAAASVRHLERALTLHSDCDAWLYYLVEALTTLTPSAASASLALLHVHRFTSLHPLHPSGWRLKLKLLLSSFPTFLSATLTSALHLLSLDPVHSESLAVLAFFHGRGWVSTDTLVRACLGSLDVAAEAENAWRWLHAGLHALQVESGAFLTWAYVGEDDERRRDGRVDEWEETDHLRELELREEDAAAEQQQQSHSQPKAEDAKKEEGGESGSRGHKRRKTEALPHAAKRSRSADAATLSLSAAPSSTPPSAASASPSLSSSLLSPSSASASLLAARFALFPDRGPLSAELRGRLQWWVHSEGHFARLKPLKPRGGHCEVGDDNGVERIRRCCLALMMTAESEHRS